MGYLLCIDIVKITDICGGVKEGCEWKFGAICLTIPYFCVILSFSNISKAMTKRVALERFYRELRKQVKRSGNTGLGSSSVRDNRRRAIIFYGGRKT